MFDSQFKTLEIGLTGSNSMIALISLIFVDLGSIGMGKSTVARHFRDLGFRVFDADAAVHKLYSKDGLAVNAIGDIFPDVIVDESVDRAKLGKIVLNDSAAMKCLEDIVHPLVANERRAFYEIARNAGNLMVIYDIPLLLEKRENYDVDYIVVVSASPETQRSRVLKRPSMTSEKFESILNNQIADSRKRELAHYVINTDSEGFAAAKAQVAQVVEDILRKHSQQWETWKKKDFKNANGNKIAAGLP
jgi:dephospho-CoA kinase